MDIFRTFFSTIFGHFVDFLFLWAVQWFARYKCGPTQINLRLVLVICAAPRPRPDKPACPKASVPPPSRAKFSPRESVNNFSVFTSFYRLSGPISRDIAILSLRYLISCDTFSGRLALPPNGAIPHPLVLRFKQAQLCDTPFCNISRDNYAIPHKSKHERVLRYYRCKHRAI